MRVARYAGPWTAALASTLLAGPSLSAQDTEWNRYTLEDLSGIYVRAEATERCTDMGMDAAELQTRAQTLLQEAEVQVLTESDMLAAPGMPDLRVTVECTPGDDDAAAYSLWVRMQQAATMVRDEQVQLAEAVTWYTTALGVTDESDLDDAVDEALEDALGRFAEAFKAANAEEAETPP